MSNRQDNTNNYLQANVLEEGEPVPPPLTYGPPFQYVPFEHCAQISPEEWAKRIRQHETNGIRIRSASSPGGPGTPWTKMREPNPYETPLSREYIPSRTTSLWWPIFWAVGFSTLLWHIIFILFLLLTARLMNL